MGVSVEKFLSLNNEKLKKNIRADRWLQKQPRKVNNK